MYLKAKQGHPQAELIDTCWDVNSTDQQGASLAPDGINRYMLGCKSFDTRAWKCQAYRINRYMLGCKYLQQ